MSTPRTDLNVRKGTQGFIETRRNAPGSGLGDLSYADVSGEFEYLDTDEWSRLRAQSEDEYVSAVMEQGRAELALVGNAVSVNVDTDADSFRCKVGLDPDGNRRLWVDEDSNVYDFPLSPHSEAHINAVLAKHRPSDEVLAEYERNNVHPEIEVFSTDATGRTLAEQAATEARVKARAKGEQLAAVESSRIAAEFYEIGITDAKVRITENPDHDFDIEVVEVTDDVGNVLVPGDPGFGVHESNVYRKTIKGNAYGRAKYNMARASTMSAEPVHFGLHSARRIARLPGSDTGVNGADYRYVALGADPATSPLTTVSKEAGLTATTYAERIVGAPNRMPMRADNPYFAKISAEVKPVSPNTMNHLNELAARGDDISGTFAVVNLNGDDIGSLPRFEARRVDLNGPASQLEGASAVIVPGIESNSRTAQWIVDDLNAQVSGVSYRTRTEMHDKDVSPYGGARVSDTLWYTAEDAESAANMEHQKWRHRIEDAR